MILKNKTIVLGITGGIAAYKAATLCSDLVKAGANVDVIMTEAAQQFVAPLTFQALTHRPVVTEMFTLLAETEIGHVSLAKRANLMIIAPATANTIAKMAAGLADNMLTTTALAARSPILLAPAMESYMWANPLTQENVSRLNGFRDVTWVGPKEGRLASGAVGVGRLAEPIEILDAARWILGKDGPLAGRKIVVTSGGTREPVDPIRYLGNRSSGRMGRALALAARDLGARVTLISTADRMALAGMKLVSVETASEMHDAVIDSLPQTDVLLMAAAVADFRPAEIAGEKIKKGQSGLTLELAPTFDILTQVGSLRRPGQLIVGFAAETENLLENAKKKLSGKQLDLIVANDARRAMGSDLNQVTLLSAGGQVVELPEMTKEEVAGHILEWVVEHL
ncbi:MAG: bifunctional phosphopantothenoylcysteine decarboxylase/phosphopantothenate--cysteine ligase CoaBC [Anaerolineales bacterium]|nr:bifunctional phosphopantothenoylcysteine decarboxylase/phosphopantothenate--cysteine ligase CoaBC [Anaerolineales bacterium]